MMITSFSRQADEPQDLLLATNAVSFVREARRVFHGV